MKKIRTLLVSAIAALTMGTASSMTASADDINDVAQALREACVPEGYIQAMLNAYQYCEKDENGVYIEGYYYPYDGMVFQIQMSGGEEVNAQIEKLLQTKLDDYYEFMATATTTTQTTPNGESGSTTTTTTTTKTFEEMTLDEKVAYLYSLPEDERQAFIDNLTVDEKQSILQEMDPDSQAEILDSFKQILEELGFHMTVGDIKDNQIDVSIRDGEGNLIDSSSMGVVVEDTGWNLTGWFALASVFVLISIGGIGYVMYRTGKESEEEQHG